MKRIILAAFCVIFTVGLFAQKALIIHKKDGTKIEIPFKGINEFQFVGKAIVNDDDYTSISNLTLHSGVNLDVTFTVNNHSDDPYIKTEKDLYGSSWGVLYSTTPNVTIENGELIEINGGTSNTTVSSMDILFGESKNTDNLVNGKIVDLEHETTYYIRSFILDNKNNKYFYSKEVNINTGKPAMIYYGVTADPSQYAETGYVMPTDSAWASFAERFPYFTVKGSCKDVILECWHSYMNKNIAKLKSQCSTIYECCDGMLYILDNIGDDFCKYALDLYDDAFTMAGYTENTTLNACNETSPVRITCDATWNIPNNCYWEYTGLVKTSNQYVETTFDKPLLSNYYYKIEITFAPDVTGADTLPTKYNVIFRGLNESGKEKKLMQVNNQVTNAQSVTIATLDSVSTGNYGKASIEIKQSAARKDTEYSRILRIAQIKVTPIGPMKKDDE